MALIVLFVLRGDTLNKVFFALTMITFTNTHKEKDAMP